ncbi:MAG TPA: trypsin-like peptidase domain-containing protein [Planctomycetaceae bacterium]|nr:trypsin-like peptidase domain-containing protein [Planctomycetaceae bacterium]HQZ65740.1 trypsin-like peptidase domain-containing protein [Planctomycetaceae bacterium]
MSDSDQDSRSARGHRPAAANGWLVMVLIGLVAVLLFRSVTDTWSNRHDYTQRTVTPRGEFASDEASRIELFEKVAPSVVYIRTKGKNFQPTQTGSIPDQEFASGTGFVWDENGHIVTNLHVVRDALLRQGAQLEVQLANSSASASSSPQVFPAEFVGAVFKHDIAVLKIEAEPSLLVPITIGSSDDLKVGQSVLAIGNPFGFDHTLSTGVIGGLNRTVGSEDGNILAGMIQTDAAINPGNSGGPLLDSAGRLIGVTTAIVSTSGASAGLGFAVPVNDVHRSVELVMHEAINNQTPSMGVAILDSETAKDNGIPPQLLTGGLVILYVYPNTPADAVGLQGCSKQGARFFLGDQITAIEGHSITTFDELTELMSAFKAGQSIKLDIARGGLKTSVQLVLEARKVLL